MITTTVRIDGQVLVLDPRQDVDRLKTRIVAVSQGKSEFVDFDVVNRGTVSVLITPTESVSVETLQRSDEETLGMDTSPPAFDIDRHDYID